jgi:hypothetical protein
MTTPASSASPIPIPNLLAPRATTTTPTVRDISPISVSTKSLDFARTVRSSMDLTNTNSTAVTWALTESSGYFTFIPASGSLNAGATLTVTVTFARASASALPEGQFNLLASLITQGAPDTTLALTGIVGQPPVIGTFTLTLSEAACTRLDIQVPITDQSSLAKVGAKITYSNPQSPQVPPTVIELLFDSGNALWVASLISVPQWTTSVIVKIMATDIYGFSSSADAQVTRSNSC